MSVYFNMSKKIQKLNNRFNGEHLVLAIFIFISTYMFIESFNYSTRARLFPQVTAVVTLVCSIALLIRGYLPDNLTDRISTQTVGQPDEIDEVVTEAEPNLKNIRVLGILVTGYALLAYLVSFLYASPVFAFVYMVYKRKAWYKILFVTSLGYVIPYGFLTAMGGPINTGIFI
jgi:hypothetical protein